MDKNIPVNKSNVKANGFRPEFLNEDSEFENIHFKAITDGLGFHHTDEAVKPKSLSVNQRLKTNAGKRPEAKPVAKVASKSIDNEITLSTSSCNTVNFMGGLEAFYQDKKEVHVAEAPKPEKSKEIKIAKKDLPATLVERTLAFVADMALIVSFLGLTFGIIIVASGVETDLILKLLTPEELLTYVGIIFSLNYLLYFTMLELRMTPGKMLFGIKVIKSNKKRLTATTTFVRSLFSLLFFPTLIVLGLKLHDKVFGTEVIRVTENE